MSNIYNLVFIFGARYLYLAVIIIGFIWFLKQPKFKQKEILLFACICVPLIYIASRIISLLYYNPRPFVSGHFRPLIAHKATNGFPSHHVLLTSALSAIIFIFNRRLSVILWILVLFIGVSRMYVGVHHLIDVVGGMLIAVMIVGIVYFTIRYFKRDFKK